MPPEWAVYLRMRTATLRRQRCRQLFDWTDEQYAAASARFCDWALAFDAAEHEGRTKRVRREAKEQMERIRNGG